MTKIIVDGMHVETNGTVYGVGHKGTLSTTNSIEEAIEAIYTVINKRKTGYIKRFNNFSSNHECPAIEINLSKVSQTLRKTVELVPDDIVDIEDVIQAKLPWNGFSRVTDGKVDHIVKVNIRTTMHINMEDVKETYLFELREIIDGNRISQGLTSKDIVEVDDVITVNSINNLSQRQLLRRFSNFLKAEAELSKTLQELGYETTDEPNVFVLMHCGEVSTTIDATLKSMHKYDLTEE